MTEEETDGRALRSRLPKASPQQLPAIDAIAPDREIKASLWEADRLFDRLAGALAVLPASDSFRRMQLRSEVAAAGILDGETVSLPDLLAIEAKLLSSEHRPDVGRALRAVRSVEPVLAAGSNRTLDPDALAVGVAEVAQSRGLAATEQPGSGADSLETVLRSHGMRSHLHEMVGVAITQARIEITGPFGPTNGLAGRLVSTVLLARHCGVPLGHLRFFLRDEEEYRRNLGSILRSMSWENWVRFFLRRVCESAAECVNVAARFVAMRERHRLALATNLGYAVSKGLVVLDRLCRCPLVTVADVQGITGTSYVAANTLVGRLVDLGILEEVTGFRRNRVFCYSGYTPLFDTPGPSPGRGRPATKPAGPERVAGPAHAGQPPALRRGSIPISDHLL